MDRLLVKEAEDWTKNGVIANAIDNYSDAILLDPESYIINFALDAIEKLLQNKECRLDSDSLSRIEKSMEAIKKFNGSYKSVAERIIESAKDKLNPY